METKRQQLHKQISAPTEPADVWFVIRNYRSLSPEIPYLNIDHKPGPRRPLACKVKVKRKAYRKQQRRSRNKNR